MLNVKFIEAVWLLNIRLGNNINTYMYAIKNTHVLFEWFSASSHQQLYKLNLIVYEKYSEIQNNSNNIIIYRRIVDFPFKAYRWNYEISSTNVFTIWYWSIFTSSSSVWYGCLYVYLLWENWEENSKHNTSFRCEFTIY